MSVKQDRQGARTVSDLEQRYYFGKKFAEVLGVADDARTTAIKTEEKVNRIEKELLEINVLDKLNVSAGTLTLKAGGLVIESNGFSLSEENGIVATKGVIGGCKMVDGKLVVPSEFVSGKILATQIDAVGLVVNKVHSISERYGDLTIDGGELIATRNNGTYQTFLYGGYFGFYGNGYGFAFDYQQDRVSALGKPLSMDKTAWFSDGVDFCHFRTADHSTVIGDIHLINNQLEYRATNGYSLRFYGENTNWFYGSWSFSGENGCSVRFEGNVLNSGGGIQFTSDRNAKNSIKDMPEEYGVLFDNLRPVIHKFNNGTSGRYHAAYVAQEVDSAREKAGIQRKDFAAVCIENEGLENEAWYLRYTEFIPIHTYEIQKLKARIAELERKVNVNEQET